MKSRIKLVMAFFIVAACIHAGDWQGKCVGVSDDDAIKVLRNGREERVRLYGVDCPEAKQDFGERAKEFTSSLVFGNTVSVEAYDQDRYGRCVAMLWVDGRNVNQELIIAGLAWVYGSYCKSAMCEDWRSLERAVMASRIGIWSRDDFMPPWQYRKMRKKRNTATMDATANSTQGR